jgi:excisionase family DNA binding protein
VLVDVRRRRGSSSPTTPTPVEFLSTGEVARLFGVSASSVTRWARIGALKSIRTPGGHYRFLASEIRRTSTLPDDELLRLD